MQFYTTENNRADMPFLRAAVSVERFATVALKIFNNYCNYTHEILQTRKLEESTFTEMKFIQYFRHDHDAHTAFMSELLHNVKLFQVQL